MKKKKAPQRSNFENTRKALRKQKRQEKKVHRQEHYMKKKSVQNEPKFAPGRFVKRPAEDTEPEVVSKKKKKQSNQLSFHDLLNKEQQKEKKDVQRLNSQMNKQRQKMLVQANEDEDKMIKKLEKQLGLNKAKNKNKLFSDDGLDYLLEVCDRATSEQIVAAEKHLANVQDESDFEEDLAAVTGKETKKKDNNGKKKDSNSLKKEEKKKRKPSQSEDNTDLSDQFSDNEELSGEDRTDLDEKEISDEDEELDADDASDSDLEDMESEFDESVVSDEAPKEKPSESKKSTQKTKSQETSRSGKERIIKAEDLNKVFSDDEVSHLSGDDDDMEGFSDDELGENDREPVDKKNKEKPEVWEDIYGRKRDKEGNVIKEEKGVYIPPHLRNKDSASDKELIQLKRQIKSVLNKLAGTNLHWASSTIEALYSSHSRHAVNGALCALWAEAAGAGAPGAGGAALAPARLVAEHAALVAVLHANVGEEIGAHFLQELTKRFDALMQSPQPQGDKTLDNIVCCLSYLYSFKLYHAKLLYDILSRLMETVSEKNIECVLVALRCVGGALRREEPLALRSFIHDTQQRVAGVNEGAADGSRIKFLLEVLMAVKNNNLTKIPQYDPSYCEELTKVVRGVVRKGKYVVPLNVSLEDLLKADERGKWWVVGSAWEGARGPAGDQPTPPGPPAPPAGDQALLQLAREQRMNTDVRRSIFCVIMAAEDYMSALSKLSALCLRGAQQREVAHVVLACCLRERVYNPYYGVLAAALARNDRTHQLSFQFSCWDKIKDLESLSKLELTNLAQFMVHLLLEKALPLSVIKIIEFSDLTKRTVKFMRQILLAIIMNEDLKTSLEVFHKVAKSPKLHMFRESLRLFIQHFLFKHAEKRNDVLSEKEMAILKERAQEVDKILTMHESKVMF